MKILRKKKIQILIGLAITMIFMYLAVRKVDWGQIGMALRSAHYVFLIPATMIIFFSHWLRSLRWKYLLAPFQSVPTGILYSSLLIGYMGNSFLPAHLGELFRAYIVTQKRQIPFSTVFASVIVERVIDMLTLLLLMGITMIIYPFPAEIKQSGYIVFAGTLILCLLMVMMKKHPSASVKLINKLGKKLPAKIRGRVDEVLTSFLAGFTPLKAWWHYGWVFLLTLLIWLAYGLIFYITFYAFDFVAIYHLNWEAALVLLVITTIGI